MFLLSSELADPTLIIDPITEERASRTLYRIELLRRIREQVLPNPLLSERLKLCQPSPDLPEWWECGRHDHDLLLGASKHGVSRTDYHILNDPTLSFLEAHQRFTSQRGSGVYAGGQGETPRAGVGVAEGVGTLLLATAELDSAAAVAANMAAGSAKKEVAKTVEEKTELEVKKETEDIPQVKTESPEEEKEDQGGAEEGNNEIVASPKPLKAEESGTEAETKEQTKTETEAVKAPDDGDVPAEMETKVPAETSGEQEEGTTQLSKQSSPKELSNPEERDTLDSPRSPKSADTVKTPEEEDEERMDEDDKSEKSSQAEGEDVWLITGCFFWFPCLSRQDECVPALSPASTEQKNFDEESIASVSTSAQNETRDGFCPDDLPETSALQVFQERNYSFSFWPKVSVQTEAKSGLTS